ncbi:sll1863 family stress response protein [Roseicyclus sp.]
MTTQDVYVERAKAQLDKWNAEIRKMRADLKEAQGKGEDELERQLDELKERRDEAEGRLQEIGRASGAAWQDMIDGFEKAWHALENGMQKARDRYAGS